MGLGLNELRLLRNTIKDMAAEKGIIYKDAIREFFKSLEKQYDIKFRLKNQPQLQVLYLCQVILMKTNLIQLIMVIILILNNIIQSYQNKIYNNSSDNNKKLDYQFITIIIATVYGPMKMN